MRWLRKWAAVGAVLWLLVFLLLAFFVGIGAAVLFFTFMVATSYLAIRCPGMGEWISGREFNEEQKAKMARISSSPSLLQAFVVTNIVLIVTAVLLLLHNMRLADVFR